MLENKSQFFFLNKWIPLLTSNLKLLLPISNVFNISNKMSSFKGHGKSTMQNSRIMKHGKKNSRESQSTTVKSVSKWVRHRFLVNNSSEELKIKETKIKKKKKLAP